MPRRRPPASVTRLSDKLLNKFGRAARVRPELSAAVRRCAAEALEPRTLFTTLTAGPGAPQTFQYIDSEMKTDTITYSDVTFEAIGGGLDTVTQTEIAQDLIQPSTPPPPFGLDLYKVYVTSSHADSYISVSSPTGFGGSISVGGTDIKGNPHTIQMPGGTGTIILGGFNGGIQLLNNVGLFPAPDSGVITPGITVLPVDPATDLQNDFGDFIVAGTVTGTVSFGGNLDYFEAGAVVTGNSDGGTLPTPPTATQLVPDNFHVAGDLRSFIATGPVGTDATGSAAAPIYVSDFDLTVGGSLGEFHVGGNEFAAANSDFFGTIHVNHSKVVSRLVAPPVSNPNLASTTFPVLGELTPQSESEDIGTLTAADTPADAQAPKNDQIADAQVLGSIPVLSAVTGLPITDADGNIIYEAEVGTDSLNPNAAIPDPDDFYAMSFLAGQTFQVSLTVATTLTVFDPDGREIATNANSGQTPQSITADRPGEYRFEVSDAAAVQDYVLTITGPQTAAAATGIGDMGIGGVVVNDGYADLGFDGGITSDYGDVGAIDVTGSYISTTTGPTPAGPNQSATTPPADAASSISVPAGNLRSVIAAALGGRSTADNLVLIDGPTLNVPFGSVGLIRSTSDVLNVNSQFDPNALLLNPQVFRTNNATATAIGGSIQVIDAATTFQGNIATDAGIGTIHAGDMDTDTASYFDVNADNTGDDGIIDLVDVQGQVGTAAAGGPAFVTNDGGDVRYFLVPDGDTVFNDEFFGGGVDVPIQHPIGENVRFTDDGGNTIAVSPQGVDTYSDGTTSTDTGSVDGSAGTITRTGMPTTNPTTGITTSTTVTLSSGPQITTLLYAVRDKGGQIPMQIDSTQSVAISASGTSGSNSRVEIASVEVTGAGRPVIALTAPDQFGNLGVGLEAPGSTTATLAGGSQTGTTISTSTGNFFDPTDLSVFIGGPATVDVLQTIANGDATSIINNTRGELATVESNSFGDLIAHGNLGFATGVATAAAVMPRAIVGDGGTYPFVQQHTGVVDNGDAVDIVAYGALGNIIAPNGTIENVIANFAASNGNKNPSTIPGQINGIVGPILTNRVLNVDVGQGLTPTGTGEVGFSGIFATGLIGLVNNYGNPNGDIRGNIISEEGDVLGVGIDSISLRNASIIGSKIEVHATGDFSLTDDPQSDGENFFTPLNLNPFTVPFIYDIGSITVSGLGGILGSLIGAGSIGPINVNGGGFGIFTSNIISLSPGRIASIAASGYGFRTDTISGGAFVGPIVATGNGGLLSTNTFPLDVRFSDESNAPNDLDPYFGILPDGMTDIDATLGTSAETPVIPDSSDTGVVADTVITGQEDFAGVTAQKTRVSLPVYNQTAALPEPVLPNIPVPNVAFTNRIAFGGTVARVHIYQETDGLQITASHLYNCNLSSNVTRVGISVAGLINNFVVRGQFGTMVTDPETGNEIPDSYLSATGPSGIIGSLKVLGDLFANVTATGEIKNLTVAGDVDGSINAQGESVTTGLQNLRISGGLRDGALNVNGNVGTIIINGGLGSPTGSLTINGNATAIRVGADRSRRGSALQLALTVNGSLGTLAVFGSITGAVHVGTNLNNLMVTGDGTTPNIITGAITVGGALNSATITNGSIASDVTIGGHVGRFTINNGNILSTSTVQSQIDGFANFRLTGNLLGSLLAPSGQNENVYVSGNVGDGGNPATITALSGNLFRIGGSVLGGSSIAVTGPLNTLLVNGSVAAGASIVGNPIKRVNVLGQTLGTVAAG